MYLVHHCTPDGQPRHWHGAGAQNPSSAPNCGVLPALILARVHWGWLPFPVPSSSSVCEINELALPVLGNLFHFNEIQLVPSAWSPGPLQTKDAERGAAPSCNPNVSSRLHLPSRNSTASNDFSASFISKCTSVFHISLSPGSKGVTLQSNGEKAFPHLRRLLSHVPTLPLTILLSAHVRIHSATLPSEHSLMHPPALSTPSPIGSSPYPSIPQLCTHSPIHAPTRPGTHHSSTYPSPHPTCPCTHASMHSRIHVPPPSMHPTHPCTHPSVHPCIHVNTPNAHSLRCLLHEFLSWH